MRKPQPTTLSGRHVRLEPLSMSHAPDLWQALAADWSIWRWMPRATPASLAEIQSLIEADLESQAKGIIVVFSQLSQTSGLAVGTTSYLNISCRDRGLEIGSTWLGKPWQRTAMNTEAKYLLLRHAFEDLGAVRVQLKTDRRNQQSQAAIERLGAKCEGILRKHMFLHDGFIRDSVMYSLLDDEWPAVKARLEARLATSS